MASRVKVRRSPYRGIEDTEESIFTRFLAFLQFLTLVVLCCWYPYARSALGRVSFDASRVWTERTPKRRARADASFSPERVEHIAALLA
eukprot:354234-Prymnesium_polylepis.1